MISKIFNLTVVILLLVTFQIYAGNNPTNDDIKNINTTRIKGVSPYGKKEGKPKVFIEGIWLDFDYMRRHLPYIDFVNDPAVADIHIIINNRISGSGGQVYSIRYNNNTFENFTEYTLSCTTASSDTYEERRGKIVNTITLGLMPFANETEVAGNLSIRYRGEQNEIKPIVTDDPWHNWTFRGTFNGDIYMEESRKNFNYSYNLRADKVTEDWRIRNFGQMSVRTREYEDDGEIYRSENTSSNISSSVVNSLSSRWSAGAFFGYSNSNYSNLVYSISAKPAVEYNIFPWDISDRKVFTIAYYIGPEWKRYYEETIYGKFQESLWEQTLRLDLQIVQTWGEIEAGLDASNYLHDFSKNRITFDSDLSVRIVRGFSVNFNFRVENIHDQIYLAKGDVSLEDILLNKVQLPSTFEVRAGVGVRLQFGSIYNNIVNNRL
ncbi:hypothetical protein [Maribellus maritimus]|uniref:hypothetical protein n=1 Tax=Maribellus maritimus TaxID=2870838 RepID=UPI001EECEA44|nr:hypothetical protein [Maribellus maritimus]MCG6189023.1 hypothetical protein [Maribellus maritimus]